MTQRAVPSWPLRRWLNGPLSLSKVAVDVIYVTFSEGQVWWFVLNLARSGVCSPSVGKGTLA
jgi:hypothetical protein